MNSELTFLMELFLEEELPKTIKLKIVARIKEIEQNDYGTAQQAFVPIVNQTAHNQPGLACQAPSTQRLLAQHPDLALAAMPPQAMTPQAAEALRKRQEVLMGAGKEEKGRTSPRKF